MRRLPGLLLSWILIFLVVIGAGEILARAFTRVTFRGTSRNALTANRFGPAYGNAPNFTGESFGTPFTTDERGFRIDPDIQDPIGAPGILILGDSVAFGAGVAEPQTLAGRLRKARPDRRIYNASSIGYDANDYMEAGTRLIPALQPRDVFVIYCLNDVAARTAQDIQDALADAHGDQSSPKADGWLRSRSKLYLFAMNAFRDTSLQDFEGDLALYAKGQPFVDAELMPLVRLRDAAQRAGARFTVIVLPYEPQLRSSPDPDLAPQRMVGAFLRGRQIPFEDALPRFAKAGRSQDLFLYGDPRHLSSAGHELVLRMLIDRLTD